MSLNPDQLHHTARAASYRQEGVLVLEDVSKESMYKLLQLADNFGIQDVAIIFNKVPKFNPKEIIKKSEFYNAARWLDFQIYSSAQECLEKLKKENYKIVAPIFGKGQKDIMSTDLKDKKIAILLSDTGRELSSEAQSFLDTKIYIQKHGVTKILDVYILGGIFLYELTRQRNLYGMMDYFLSTDKEDMLRHDFSNR